MTLISKKLTSDIFPHTHSHTLKTKNKYIIITVATSSSSSWLVNVTFVLHFLCHFITRSSWNIKCGGCALKCSSEIKFGYVQTHLNDIFCREHHIKTSTFTQDTKWVKGFSEVRMSFIFNTFLCVQIKKIEQTHLVSFTDKMRLY